jgi:cytosine/adenosine deaminase-related metal-dependent hydrolase
MNGITTAAPIASLFYREWGETEAEFTAAANAAGELGLRVFLSPAFRSGGMVLEAPGRMEPIFDEERGLAGLAKAVSFIEEQDGRFGGLVRGILAPDRVETCTETLLRRTNDAARDLGCRIRLHMAQGEMELEVVQSLHGKTAPGWLHSLGVLSDRLIAPHATVATARDLELYAENGVSIIHCPLVSSRGRGAVLRSFRSVRKMGVNIAMGTDTAPPDMLLNLLAGLIAARIVEDGPQGASSADMWTAATLGGAEALGRSDLGRLTAGSCADIAIFGLDDPIMTPAIDPITTLVAGGSGKVTRAVFVDGRLSMCNGQVAGLDMIAAQARAQEQFDGLVEKYPERSWGHPAVADLFPPSFPLYKDSIT